MTAPIALVLAAGCAGGLIGAFFVPWSASVLLGRAYRRARSWWWDSLDAYRAFKQAHPLREPSPRAAGAEGSLGLWRAQALRDAQAGSLPRERLQALIEAGCAAGASEPSRSEADQEARCSFRAKRWHRCLGALVGTVFGCAVAWCAGSPLVAAALAVAATAMAAAVICDLQARIVPLEACAALAAAGVVFQASTAGLEGVLAGCAFAVFAVLCCLALNRLFGRTGRTPVGYGDVRCMAALSLASGVATPLGAALCYGGAAAFSLGALLDTVRLPRAAVLALAAAGALSAAVTATYTGVLLQSLASVLLWRTPLVPVLFVLSSASCGIATAFLAASFVETRHPYRGPLVWLARIDGGIVVVEAGCLSAFVLLAFAGEETAAAARALAFGELAPVFWGVLAVCGLAVPLVLERFLTHGNSRTQLLWIAALLLAGGFALRWCIVGAGAYDVTQMPEALYGLSTFGLTG